MNLDEQIDWMARGATREELAAALDTLQGHMRHRQDLEDSGKRGGRVGPGSRPIWADPGRKRCGGHLSEGIESVNRTPKKASILRNIPPPRKRTPTHAPDMADLAGFNARGITSSASRQRARGGAGAGRR